jgi:hypothetical protein
MAIEKVRGGGFRKVGGIYLRGSGLGVYCHLLPYELPVCPTCGHGIKFARGITKINPNNLFGICDHGKDRIIPVCHESNCFMCLPPDGEHMLMWVGEKYYTPESFAKEAAAMEVSKRISAIPRGLKLGETTIYLAHKKGKRTLVPCEKHKKGDKTLDGYAEAFIPAIFYAFKPTRIEMIVTETMAKNAEKMDELKKKGITPIVVPDNDPDHNPKEIKDW